MTLDEALSTVEKWAEEYKPEGARSAKKVGDCLGELSQAIAALARELKQAKGEEQPDRQSYD